MPLISADVGLVTFFAARFNNVWPASKDLKLRLFCNNFTAVDTSVTADFVQATGGGYAEITLTSGSWTVSIVGGIAQAAYPVQSFTFTGPLTTNLSVFGYYIVDGNNVLQWAENFTAPVAPVSPGNHIDVTPIYQGSKGTPS
jgi:hypothetical protein